MATLSAQVILSLVDKLSAPAERAANSLNQIEQRGQAASSRIKTVAAGALRAIPVAAIVAGTAASARSFAKLETTLEELGIVAGMTDEQIAGMRSGVEKTAPQLGLAAEEAYGVIQSLVQGGMDIDRATQVWPTIAKTARAASADMRDISDAGNAVMSQLGITPDELERAYDAMIEGGKMGRFELKDMAREFPALTAQAQRLGYDGVDGVIKLVAQLQYLRETAGSGSEAANNLRNLMLKVFSAETARNFEKYGIDIMDRLGEAAERGENQLEAVLDVVEEITKGMSDTEAQAVISRLFPDQQAQAGLLGLRRYREEIRQAEKEIAQTSGSVQRDWERMMDTAQGSADKLIANLKRVRNAVGEEVLPAITGVMDSINEVFDAFENRTGGVLEFFRKLRQEGGEPDAIDKAIAGAGEFLTSTPVQEFLLGVPIDTARERRKFDAMLNMQRERAGTGSPIGMPGHAGSIDLTAVRAAAEELRQLADQRDTLAAELAQRERSGFGASHPLAANLVAEMREVEAAMADARSRLSDAAAEAMSAYKQELATRGQEASAEAQAIGTEIESALEVIARPQIDTSSLDAALAKVRELAQALSGLSANVRVRSSVSTEGGGVPLPPRNPRRERLSQAGGTTIHQKVAISVQSTDPRGSANEIRRELSRLNQAGMYDGNVTG